MIALDSTLNDAFAAYKTLVDNTEPLLTDLDQRSGDGDFGANLHGGLELAAARADSPTGQHTWAALAEVFLDEVGGTSGPLFGLLFQQLYQAALSAESIETWLRDGAGSGLAAVQRVGEAQVGDRTIVDALQPGVDALRSDGGLSAAVDAAVDGAIATSDLIARRGRASYVGGRAVGFPDPGAVGIALLFVAVAGAVGLDTAAALQRLVKGAEGDGSVIETDAADEDGFSELLADVEAARGPWAALALEARAHVLDALADTLDANSDELVVLAEQETHLLPTRLAGEVARTSFQLRMFASMVRDGGFLDARIDHADPDWPASPRPDLRRSNRPIGPVLVFAASNFPFAFSVLGGDTASALAAGNPVIVKAHPGHPRLSRRTAELAADTLRSHGVPAATLTLVEGEAAGVEVLKDPRIKAAAFTGSTTGGRALFEIAQSRPTPIPFFGELGSNNPVFVTPAADSVDAVEIADGFVKSFTLGAGQFCTKPGTLFVPDASAIAAQLRDSALPDAVPLLNDRLVSSFHGRLRELQGAPHVTTLRSDGDPYAAAPSPILLHTHGAAVLTDPELYLGECFGPAAMVVEYDSPEQMLELAGAYSGQLTATIFAATAETPTELIDVLAERAGRVLWRQWPTGVSVTDAQQHGGPYPASTTPQATSVGSAAIARFLRPVALQGFPSRLLPAELVDATTAASQP